MRTRQALTRAPWVGYNWARGGRGARESRKQAGRLAARPTQFAGLQADECIHGNGRTARQRAAAPRRSLLDRARHALAEQHRHAQPLAVAQHIAAHAVAGALVLERRQQLGRRAHRARVNANWGDGGRGGQWRAPRQAQGGSSGASAADRREPQRTIDMQTRRPIACHRLARLDPTRAEETRLDPTRAEVKPGMARPGLLGPAAGGGCSSRRRAPTPPLSAHQ
jgi:hypothetical protein